MSKSPNILVVMTDDHAQWAVGAYGHPQLTTPSMDWLAHTGWRFADACTPSPVCSPARACFFTGRLPSQHGIHDWLGGGDEPPGGWMHGEVTLAQVLHDRGYHTGLVGKWHCGRDTERKPGFDHWCCYERGQYPHFGDIRLRQIDGRGERRIEAHGHQAPMLTANAVDFLRRRPADRPFFLFAGYVNTHSPFSQQPERWVEHYRRRIDAEGLLETAAPDAAGWIRFGPPPDASTRREWLAQYYAAVSHIDEQLGALLDELEAQGVLDDTLVVYTSDHGHMNGQHGLYTKGNATVPQNFYEESIRVPLLVRWPRRLAAGHVAGGAVDHCDLFATLTGAAGATLPPDRTYPGASFLPAANDAVPGAPPLLRDAQVCEYGNARMLRAGHLKFIQRFAPLPPGAGDELYDLAADPRERHNIISDSAYAGDLTRLRERLETHFARHEVPGRSGREVLSQPKANAASEPWRSTPPAAPVPPQGSDYRQVAGY